MSNGLKKYYFQVLDERGAVVTDDLQVIVKTAGTDTDATIYDDGAATALTNPIITSVFEALTNGLVEFWSAANSVDVYVIGKTTRVMCIGMTPAVNTIVFNTGGDSMSRGLPPVEYFCEFQDTVDATNEFVLADDGSGTMATGDNLDGYVTLTSDATNNDASTMGSIAEWFKFQTDKKLFFEARVKCTEAATNAANLFVGISDLITVDIMKDDGAGPADSFDGAGFYKCDANMYWEFIASNLTDQDENSDMVAYVSATWYRLGFAYDFNDGVTGKITPYVNGTAYDVVDITIAGLAEMHLALSVKAGGANAEALICDYIRVIADRDD